MFPIVSFMDSTKFWIRFHTDQSVFILSLSGWHTYWTSDINLLCSISVSIKIWTLGLCKWQITLDISYLLLFVQENGCWGSWFELSVKVDLVLTQRLNSDKWCSVIGRSGRNVLRSGLCVSSSHANDLLLFIRCHQLLTFYLHSFYPVDANCI